MKKGGMELAGTPKIAAVITGPFKKEAFKKARQADLIEIRLDTFKKRDPEKLKEDFRKKLKPLKVPLLLTIRNKKEGGKFKVTDRERLGLFNLLIPFVDFVDIELSSGKIIAAVIKTARRHKKTVLVSYHNFRNTPDMARLLEIIKNARKSGADIVKIATLAKNKGQIKRLLKVLVSNENMIVIAMGKYGKLSRVVFPYLGSLITYGAVAKTTAPGQIRLGELKRIFSGLGA